MSRGIEEPARWKRMRFENAIPNQDPWKRVPDYQSVASGLKVTLKAPRKLPSVKPVARSSG